MDTLQLTVRIALELFFRHKESLLCMNKYWPSSTKGLGLLLLHNIQSFQYAGNVIKGQYGLNLHFNGPWLEWKDIVFDWP